MSARLDHYTIDSHSTSTVFRMFKAFGVSETHLHKAEWIYLIIEDLGTTLKARSKDILNSGLVNTNKANRNPAPYRYLQLIDWEFVSGDPEWLNKIYDKYNWKLPKGVESCPA